MPDVHLSIIRYSVVEPALKLLPERMTSNAARVMLLTVGLYKSRFTYRFLTMRGQPYIKAEDRGFWGFSPGLTQKVLDDPSTKDLAVSLCEERAVDPKEAWRFLEIDDVLSAGLARLLLDIHGLTENLPASEDAWSLYVSAWSPIYRNMESWEGFYVKSLKESQGL